MAAVIPLAAVGGLSGSGAAQGRNVRYLKEECGRRFIN